jgi:putative aldouronate transport system permease protein
VAGEICDEKDCFYFSKWISIMNSLVESPLKKNIKSVLRDWRLYVLLFPAFLYVFIFHYVPMYGVIIAFKDYRTNLGIFGSKWVGLKHFARFINFPNFWLILRNTVQIGIYTLATFPLPVILALLINEIRNRKFKKFVQMITYAPYFLSTVVVASMLLLFFNANTGVFNHIAVILGFERIEYITIPRFFNDIYVWSGVWQTIGWGTIVYLAGLSNVPQDLIEAAQIDGARRLKIIWHINIPTILPTVVVMLILSCGQVLAVGFEKIYLLQNPLNLSQSQVIPTYVYEIGLVSAQFSYASAIGIFNNIINVLLIIIVNKIAKVVADISIW